MSILICITSVAHESIVGVGVTPGPNAHRLVKKAAGAEGIGEELGGASAARRSRSPARDRYDSNIR